MKLWIEIESDKPATSFALAEAFYDLCKSSFIDVETVANMMLLEAKVKREAESHVDR